MTISLRALLLWVAFAALVAAALARPSLLWTRLLFSCTAVFLVWAVIGALATRGNQRIFWIGAAAFGLAYGLMFSGSRPSPYGGDAGFEMGRVLVTQQLLDAAARAIGHEDVLQSNRATVWDPSILWQPPRNAPRPVSVRGVPNGVGVPIPPPTTSYMPVSEIDLPAVLIESDTKRDATETSGDGAAAPPNAYVAPSLTPQPYQSYPSPISSVYDPYAVAGGATPGSYGQFLLSGHCAFLILIAMIGGTLARWCFGGEDNHSLRNG